MPGLLRGIPDGNASTHYTLSALHRHRTVGRVYWGGCVYWVGVFVDSLRYTTRQVSQVEPGGFFQEEQTNVPLPCLPACQLVLVWWLLPSSLPSFLPSSLPSFLSSFLSSFPPHTLPYLVPSVHGFPTCWLHPKGLFLCVVLCCVHVVVVVAGLVAVFVCLCA